MQRKRNLEFVRKRIYHRRDLVDGHRTLRRFKTRLSRKIDLVKILAAIHHRSRTGHAPVVIYENVAHYREHPTFEIDIIDVFIFVIKYFECRILKQVVSVVAVRRQRICEIQ